MASSRDFLDYVLEQLSGLNDISYRPMMGEYVIYYDGKTVGGIYDDRFLLKDTTSARALLQKEGREPGTDIPYPGAREMLKADIDDREFTCRLVEAVASDLKEPKRKKRG